MKQLHNSYAINPTEQTLKEIRETKYQLDNIINKKTQFMLQRLRYKHFEHNDKSGKYLASQLKRNKEKSYITTIKDSTRNITNDPQTINKTFRQYCSDLYNKEQNFAEIENFLIGITLPSLTKDQADILDTPLTPTEYEKTLKIMSNNKAPGIEGFPTEFYKHFWQIISPLLKWQMKLRKTNSFLTI